MACCSVSSICVFHDFYEIFWLPLNFAELRLFLPLLLVKRNVDVNRSVWTVGGGLMANRCLLAAVRVFLSWGTSFVQRAVPHVLPLFVVRLILLSSTTAACFSRTSGECPMLSGSCCKTRSVGRVVFSVLRNVFWNGGKRWCARSLKKKCKIIPSFS